MAATAAQQVKPSEPADAGDWSDDAEKGLELRAITAFNLNIKPHGQIRITQFIQIWFVGVAKKRSVTIKFYWGGAPVEAVVKSNKLRSHDKKA